MFEPGPGKFLNIVGQDPSVYKSNWLHVDNRFVFIDLRHVLYIPLKLSVNFMKSWTWTCYFSNATGSSKTSGQTLPVHCPQLLAIIFTQWSMCCISKSTVKHWQNSDQKLDLPYFSYGYRKYMFLDSLSEYTCPSNCIHCWVWSS